MKLVFLGPPGAGKGTVAAKVSEKYNIPHISTGDILRQAMKEETKVGLLAKSYVDSGQLVPDDVILEIVKERLSMPDCAGGFLFDGFPRTLAQAEALSRITTPDCAVNIELSDDDIVKRLAGRRTCGACGGNFHTNRIGDKKECPKCGMPLITRVDDEPETVINRLAVYHQLTAPLIEYYKSCGLLSTVDGAQSYDEVFNAVCAVIESGGDECGGGSGSKA